MLPEFIMILKDPTGYDYVLMANQPDTIHVTVFRRTPQKQETLLTLDLHDGIIVDAAPNVFNMQSAPNAPSEWMLHCTESNGKTNIYIDHSPPYTKRQRKSEKHYRTPRLTLRAQGKTTNNHRLCIATLHRHQAQGST